MGALLLHFGQHFLEYLMGLPGHRRTSSHKRRRAAHFALKPMALSVCEKCQKAVQPHHACRACGFYKGREVIDMSRDVKRALTKANAAPHAHAHADNPVEEGHDHTHDHPHDEPSPEADAKKVKKHGESPRTAPKVK